MSTRPDIEKLRRTLTGLTLDQASASGEMSGLTIRVISFDSQPCMGTCDFRNDRVNVAVDGGHIIEVKSIG